ncbi:MAG: hypothetical protein AAGD25_02225 [Cyanobacteria bacterium P01_F01_bin.150]
MTKSTDGQIICQLTSTELAQIDDILSRTGQTRNEWLQGLVKAALSTTPANVRNLAERIDALEQSTAKLDILQQQVETLLQQRANQADGDAPLNISADVTPPSATTRSTLSVSSNSHSAKSIQAPSPPKPTASSSTPSIYDVEEDEPDEILYEFLEPEPSQPLSPTSSSGSIYDAEDDEPYEILYDFLEPDDRPTT